MIIQALYFFAIITVLAPIFGKYIAYIYRYDYVDHQQLKSNTTKWKSQNWKEYFFSLMYFNIICLIATFLIIYFQNNIPVFQTTNSHLSFSSTVNAAVSFVTGTFWQSHNPETQLNMLSKLFGLMAQNFMSGATGIAVFIAFVRGIINSENQYIGNFYDDFLRALIYILIPLSTITALVLIASGMPNNFIEHINYTGIDGANDQLSIGPIASQVAIKNLVANGGSFFNIASAHPFESPSREAVLTCLILVILLPTSMIFTYGFLLGSLRLSVALYTVVVIVMVSSLYVMNIGETKYGLSYILGNNNLLDNFNYIGKELIYDKFPSLMWTISVTMSSDGSANSCLENYSPLSTLILFSNLIISKFIIEGVGAGFFAMLSYLMVAVFLKGLITGETANFFGKRIAINEINYVVIVFLIMPIGVLLFTSITLALESKFNLITYQGSQAVTDISYNFASCFANNGSVFNGLKINSDYFNYTTAIAMLIGRFMVIYYSLAISGSFASKKRINDQIAKHSQSSIELGIFLMMTVLLVGAIMFLPLMILGPLLEFIVM